MNVEIPDLDVEELTKDVNKLLELAENGNHDLRLGAVNWGDLGIADIQHIISLKYREPTGQQLSYFRVTIEEASPECGLAKWLYDRLDKEKWPNVYFECEW